MGDTSKAAPTGTNEDHGNKETVAKREQEEGFIKTRTDFGSGPGLVESESGNIIWLEADPISSRPTSDHTSSGDTIADPLSYEQHGRGWAAYRDDRYFLPNDAIEQDRLDLQHEIFEQLIDRDLGLAPIARGIPSYPTNVLDVATGTGLWALEWAERHPESYVIGTDLSLIQPARELPNFQFIREDSEEPWTFDRKFDYVHLRTTCGCFSDHRTVIKNAFDNMNEGGWIEYQDVCGTFHSFDGTAEGTSLETLSQTTRRGFKNLVKSELDTVDRVLNYKRWLQAAGFINVVEQEFPVPTNSWPTNSKFKKLGKWNNADMSQAIEAISKKVFPGAGLAPDQVQQLVKDATRDLKDPRIHAWMPFYFIYGQKP